MQQYSNMVKYDYTFLSSNNQTNIHAIECYPKEGQPTRVLQVIHGMIEYIERYLPFSNYLTAHGFVVVGHDHLGHGLSVNNQEDLGYIGEPYPNDLLIKDIHALRLLTQKKYPNLPYFILGHSMGSYLLRQYICLCSEGLAGAIIMGTGFESKCKVSMGINLIQTISCCRGMRYRSDFVKGLTIGSGPYKKYDLTKTNENNSWITSDPVMAKLYNDDQRMKFDFTLNGYIGLLQATLYSCDVDNISKVKKNLPVLFVSGDSDPVGNNGEGVKKAFNTFKSVGIKDVTMKLFENDRHEILNEVNREEVYEFIKTWLEEKTLLYGTNNN